MHKVSAFVIGTWDVFKLVGLSWLSKNLQIRIEEGPKHIIKRQKDGSCGHGVKLFGSAHIFLRTSNNLTDETVFPTAPTCRISTNHPSLLCLLNNSGLGCQNDTQPMSTVREKIKRKTTQEKIWDVVEGVMRCLPYSSTPRKQTRNLALKNKNNLYQKG